MNRARHVSKRFAEDCRPHYVFAKRVRSLMRAGMNRKDAVTAARREGL